MKTLSQNGKRNKTAHTEFRFQARFFHVQLACVSYVHCDYLFLYFIYYSTPVRLCQVLERHSIKFLRRFFQNPVRRRRKISFAEPYQKLQSLFAVKRLHVLPFGRQRQSV